jgi:hypothetical protein
MFAIRQKSTGYYIPLSRKKKGYTWDVPEKDCIPRLFKRHCDASSALNKWLKGPQMYKLRNDKWVKEIVPPVIARNAEDMEIVLVAIVIATLG